MTKNDKGLVLPLPPTKNFSFFSGFLRMFRSPDLDRSTHHLYKKVTISHATFLLLFNMPWWPRLTVHSITFVKL